MNKPLAEGVHTFLDASTGHITSKDNDILRWWAKRELADSFNAAPYRTIGHTYGYFVHVPQGEAIERRQTERVARAEGLSDAFFALQQYAREHGCWWINLDRDADLIEGLPSFTW